MFDWGDTLMRYEWNDEVALAGNRAGIAALAARDGLPPAEAIHAYFKEREAQLFDDAREDEIDFVELNRACFSELGCELEDDDVRLYVQATYDVWEQTFTVPPAAHALLDALRKRGLKLALVSNTAQREWLLRPVFERQGLAERVDAIVLSSEVGKRKPHPVIFQRALEELGVRGEECLFVGDRLYNDVRGASELGMATVQALWFRADEHANGAEPDHRAFTMLDVLNIADRRLACAG
jgi:putative hydrolase of the HAD superfamily